MDHLFKGTTYREPDWKRQWLRNGGKWRKRGSERSEIGPGSSLRGKERKGKMADTVKGWADVFLNLFSNCISVTTLRLLFVSDNLRGVPASCKTLFPILSCDGNSCCKIFYYRQQKRRVLPACLYMQTFYLLGIGWYSSLQQVTSLITSPCCVITIITTDCGP